MRWISGVRKDKDEPRDDTQPGTKPGGSVAGAGRELVGLLTQVMHTLKRKDEEGRRQGVPKKCWFIESVEEVAQPLRFDAHEVAKHKKTATTVDFVTMYPSFDQNLLKARLKDAMGEAWAWERRRCERGEVLRMRADGWVRLTEEEARKPSIGIWSQEEVCELVMFVVDNGCIHRGKRPSGRSRGSAWALHVQGR